MCIGHKHTLEEVCVSEREAGWVEGDSILGDSFLAGRGFITLDLVNSECVCVCVCYSCYVNMQ